MSLVIMCSALCILLLVVFAGKTRLKLRNDYFFLIFLFFGVIYTVIAPELVLQSSDVTSVESVDSYHNAQSIIVVFFLLPICMAYRILSKGISKQDQHLARNNLSEIRVVLVCVFFLALEVAFTLLALKNEMYVRRIGTEKIAELISEIDMMTLIIIRTHDLVVLPVITLLAILLPAIKRQMSVWTRILAYASFSIIVLSFIVFSIANSRTQLILLVVALIFAAIIHGNAKFRLNVRALTLTALALTYGLIVVSNYRNHGADEPILADILNPVSFISEADSDAFNQWEWTQRLDCVNLITQMDESLQFRGYEMGEAWKRPIISMFGQIVGSDLATEYKANAITTAKSYLLEEHTEISQKDYPSCMLTDLWGNFWIYGLPVAGILVACCFALLRYGLTAAPSPLAFVASLVFAFYFVTFEKEFVDWIIGWIKLIPAIALLAILNPIQSSSAHMVERQLDAIP